VPRTPATATGSSAQAATGPAAVARIAATPFRFYDNRQKYLAFVNTCNEKSSIARRAPSEICDRIGTSTLFAAWNAAIYVNQIEDDRLDAVVQTGGYLEATQAVLQRYGGLWFNDETFVVSRRRSTT
jgi:hypothetical protein